MDFSLIRRIDYIKMCDRKSWFFLMREQQAHTEFDGSNGINSNAESKEQ